MKSLQGKFFIALAICMGVALAAMLAVAYFYISAFATSNSTLAMENAITELATDVNNKVLATEQSTSAMNQFAVSQLQANPHALDTREGTEQFLELFRAVALNEAENTYGAITVYFVLNPDTFGPSQGFFLTRNSLDVPFENTPVTDVTAYADDDLEHVGWYYSAVENGGPLWTLPYYNSNIDVLMTSHVIPLYAEDNSLIGVMGMDLNFKVIEESITNATVFSNSGSAALFSPSGFLLYQKDYPATLGGDVYVFEDEQAAYTDADLAAIENLLQAATLSATSNDATLCSWKGEEYRIVGKILENDMMLVAMVPEDDIQKPITRLLAMCTGIALAIMVLAAIAAMIVARSITRPLRHLANASQEIADGNLDVEIVVESQDEVGQLAESFQKMTDELRERMNEITEMAYVDPLTGIGSRAAYVGAMEHAKREIASGLDNLVIAVLDVNDLKQTNDNFGHEAGDALLVDASKAAVRALGINRVYRIGGDEFAGVLLHEENTDAQHWSDCIHEAICHVNATYEAGERPYPRPLSVAWGVAVYDPAKHASYEDVFNEADEIMYDHKQRMKAGRKA